MVNYLCFTSNSIAHFYNTLQLVGKTTQRKYRIPLGTCNALADLKWNCIIIINLAHNLFVLSRSLSEVVLLQKWSVKQFVRIRWFTIKFHLLCGRICDGILRMIQLYMYFANSFSLCSRHKTSWQVKPCFVQAKSTDCHCRHIFPWAKLHCM
jgi:hypothetical protein